jgi:hypothetical protein
MPASHSPARRPNHPAIALLLTLALWMTASLAVPATVAGQSPAAAESPAASQAPPTMCEVLDDLRLYLGFVRDQAQGDGGLLPILVGTAASIAEARALLPLVGEEYRPLVQALLDSLEDLRTAVRGFGDAGTVGAGLVEIGESIVVIGTSLDALSIALRQPCPEASPAPVASPAA